MLRTSDASAITAIGVLCAAATALLESAGSPVPIWIPAAVTITAAVAISLTRIYVAVVGEDKTYVDEALEQAEALIADARNVVRK
jgi:hypothetical protein